MGSAFQNKDITHSTNQQTEAGNVTDFRNSLYPQLSSFLARAQQPVYGDRERAQFMNQLNKTGQDNEKGLAARLASRTGSVNSGAYASGLGSMFQNRLGQQAAYDMATPLKNRQYGDQQTLAGLNMGNAMAGPALRGSTGDSETSHQTGWGNSLASLGGAALGGGLGFGLGMGGFGGMFGMGGPKMGSYSQPLMQNPYGIQPIGEWGNQNDPMGVWGQ